MDHNVRSRCFIFFHLQIKVFSEYMVFHIVSVSRAGFPLPFPLYNPFQGVLPIQPIQPIAPVLPPILSITPPTYPTYPTPAVQTCICVPTGSCTGTVPTTASGNYGSGLIDIRIVNNVCQNHSLHCLIEST